MLYAGADPLPRHGNRMLTEMMGARIRSLGKVDEAERDWLARQAVAELAAAGRRPYLVGEPVIGALGYVRAAHELHEQANAAGLDLRHIVLPGSMGVTEAGMILGAAILNLGWTFHLISVEFDPDGLEMRNRAILKDLCRATQFRPTQDLLARVQLHMDQLGAGYGMPTGASLQASDLFAKLEALVLERTYVAKNVLGTAQLRRQGDYPDRRNGLCGAYRWHAGHIHSRMIALPESV